MLVVSPRAGKVGDTITVTPHGDSIGSMSVQLMYVGAETTSPRGVKTPARAPVTFGFARFEPVQQWTARIVAWTDSTDPRTKPTAFNALLQTAAAVARTLPRLDWMWSRPPLSGIPATRMVVDAATRVVLPAGTHTLRTLSDDAIRVWVDGVLVIDHWTPHETMADYATIRGGAHDLRVQYVQVDGWTELRVDFLRGMASRSTGSVVPF